MSLDKSTLIMIATMADKVVDVSLQRNAKSASGAGLEVRVSRTYDGVGLSGGRDCQWCKDRECNNVTIQEAYRIGAFQRHEGCGCVVEYTSNKGVKTIQTGKYSGWNFAEELEKRRSIGLNEKFFTDELMSRVAPHINIDAEKLYRDAKNGEYYKKTFKYIDSLTKPQLEKSIRSYIRETEEHEWKIQNPQKYMSRSDPNDPNEIQIALNDWNNHKKKNSRLATIGLKLWREKYGRGL